VSGEPPELYAFQGDDVMKAVLTTLLLSLGVLNYGTRATAEDKKPEKADVNNHVFEMRTYYAAPGKMKALHARFRDHTCKLFEKHSITIIGFWVPIGEKESEEKLVYILAYPSKEAAERSWNAFKDDPAWIEAKKASEKDGPLVKKVESVFLNPTDYSPIK
jgi:NIPSNAP